MSPLISPAPRTSTSIHSITWEKTAVRRHRRRPSRVHSITWEETPCLLCGHDRSHPVIAASDATGTDSETLFQVVECLRCGLKFTNPRPTVESIGQFYPHDYRPHRRPRSKARVPHRPHLLDQVRGRAGERRKLDWHGQGRLLDFGCGGGSYLARLADQGWRVTGIDNSAEAVHGIREELGLPAFFGTLPHPALTAESFDVITMWHSLEHVHEPRVVLREARKLLAPGGRLLVAVPNIQSWPFQWFGSAWFSLDLPRHLIHFTPDTLRAALEITGFEVASIRMLRHSDWLRSTARRSLAQQGRRQTLARILSLKPFSRLAAHACFLARRSDCILATATRS